MKKVLSLLLVFVFLKAQALALSGGPVFSNAQGNYVGVYSGALVPRFTTFVTSNAASAGSGASIGLFTLSQPDTGLATGSLVMFIDGAPFSGTITGIIDNDTGELNAVLDAASTFTITILTPVTTTSNGTTTTTFQSQSYNVAANGSLNAEVIPTGFFNTSSTVSVTPSRLTGDAQVDVFFRVNATTGTPDVTKTVVFDVDGFKQSDTAGTTGAALGTGTGA